MKNKLYVVATPIGNLEDITLRALRVLKEVDYIICENKKQTSKLLARYNIQRPLVKEKEALRLLSQGKNLALVSDAGTPGISDPGAKLVQEVYDELEGKVEAIPIPGPNAAVAALSVSGIPFKSFLFLGFPPIKKKRKKFFERVAKNKKDVTILYESPHRILKTLKELQKITSTSQAPTPFKEKFCFSRQSRSLKGAGQVVVFKELTKIYERMWKGSPEEVLNELQDGLQKEKIKGEFIIIIDNRNE